jgi:hypothetical protein
VTALETLGFPMLGAFNASARNSSGANAGASRLPGKGGKEGGWVADQRAEVAGACVGGRIAVPGPARNRRGRFRATICRHMRTCTWASRHLCMQADMQMARRACTGPGVQGSRHAIIWSSGQTGPGPGGHPVEMPNRYLCKRSGGLRCPRSRRQISGQVSGPPCNPPRGFPCARSVRQMARRSSGQTGNRSDMQTAKQAARQTVRKGNAAKARICCAAATGICKFLRKHEDLRPGPQPPAQPV